MAIAGYLVRSDNVVWRDIAGEVVIAERNNSTMHVLNKTAGLIWSLADGTKQVNDIAADISKRFDVSLEQAQADTEEFYDQLLELGLINMKEEPQEAKEV